MKKFLCLLLRTSFLSFYFLALFKSRMVLAQSEPSLTDMPVVSVADLNFSVKAPSGWKVRQNYRGRTLVLEDTLVSQTQDATYNRNITVAVQSGPRPIDALEKDHLVQKLSEEFSKGASDFQIIESRIIDYRSKSDAILVFSSFTRDGIPMRQMHIFTSGSEHTVLLTFTDLQDSFEAEGALNKAWVSMMSADLKGEAPHRYDGLMYSGSGLALIVTAAFFSKQLRRRYQQQALKEEENALFDLDLDDDEDDEFEVNKHMRTQLAASGTEDWQFAETRYAGQIA